MKTSVIHFIFTLIFCVTTQAQDKQNIYLFPGQGADGRLFKKLDIEGDYNLQVIDYSVPEKGMSMRDYAEVLSEQIDTTSEFILIGSSLGGMLATEISDFLNPEKTIIISSAKNASELPWRYNFQKKVPIYKLVGPRAGKFGAKILQPIVEPDRKIEKETFDSMLDDLDPYFLKRTIAMILEWDKTENTAPIIHIHGTKDRTIPIKNVDCDLIIDNASHMLTLINSDELNVLLNQLLSDSSE